MKVRLDKVRQILEERTPFPFFSALGAAEPQYRIDFFGEECLSPASF